MKRIDRHPEKFDLLELFDALGRQEGATFDLTGASGDTEFFTKISSSLNALKKNPALLHGKRTEAMFGAIAASLGSCLLVKAEDAGEIFAREELQPPDYRVVLESGRQILVEVKNHHPTDPMKPFSMKESYVMKLLAYSKLLDVDLRFAILWSRWTFWTLVPLSRFSLERGIFSITMDVALRANEMADVGDYQLGTTPPLLYKLIADPTMPRSVAADGKCVFRIGSVEIHCGGNRIEDVAEQKIAWFLILFGSWNLDEPTADVRDGLLHSVDYSAVPEQPASDVGLCLVDAASTMISRCYSHSTESATGIRRLTPREFVPLMPSIPIDYVGRDLPLLRLVQKPS